ncbi:MAG TPA: nucleoside triphosphate pyrophosphohydrolase [Dongiaceae bacterium]
MNDQPTNPDPLAADRPPLERLIAIMARLRDPERGCPWDVEQSFASIAPYTIEEAYEVADAIQQGDMGALKDELGDLLLQVVFHAQMAREAGSFGIEDVARAINDKMVKRHPHVFADAVVEGAEAQTLAWEAQKAGERQAKGAVEGRAVGALDGVTVGLPALTRALKLQRRAARVGFDWPAENAMAEIEAKLAEELNEIKAEMAAGNKAALADECGDLLFVCVNLLRHLGVDPESALRSTNAKFERRFRAVEVRMKESGFDELATAGIDRLEAAWQAVKAEERQGKP